MTGSPAGHGEGRGARRRFLPAIRLGVLAIAVAMVVLAVGSSMTLAAGGESSNEPKDAAEPQAVSPETPEGVEIKSARTATSDTFRLPDGAREARLYEAPVNYKDGEGNWKPIEEELEPRPGGGLTNGADFVDLSLPQRLGSAPVKVAEDGDWVSDRLLGGGSESAEVEGATATYEAASPGTNFELSSIPGGVKETIELANSSQPSSFHYELDAAQGLVPSLERDGSVAYRRQDGTEVAQMPAPTITDSSAGALPNSQAVHYNLTPMSNGNWELSLSVEKAWLEAPGRAWPVKIDPSTVTVGESYTCEIFMQEPAMTTGNWCNSLSVTDPVDYRREGSTVTRQRALMSWAVHPAVPTGAYVASAKVGLYANYVLEGSQVQLRQVTSGWKSPTWIKAETGRNWTTPGGDFSSAGEEIRGTKAGSYVFEEGLTPVVRGWVDGSIPNDGLILALAAETPCESSCNRGEFNIADALWTEPSRRPYLAVEYFPQAPLTSKLVSPTEGTRTPRRLKLKSKWTAAGVEGVTYQYREGKTGPFQTIPAELVHNAEGKAVSWPLPVAFAERESKPLYFDAAHVAPTLRKKGGVIQVRALFEGPTEVAGYSAPVEADVNRSLGAVDDATASVGPGSVDLLTGNFSTSNADVSIPTFNSSLEFSRSFNSRGLAPKGSTEEAEEEKSPLGPGWKPGVPVEEAGGSEWRNLKIVEEKGQYEEEIGEEEIVQREYSYSYAIVTDLEGGELPFEKTPSGYVAPPEVTGWSLTIEEGKFVLSDPAGDRTTFSNLGVEGEYVPTAISQPGGSGVNTTRVEYELKEIGGKKQKRVHMVVAPTPPGITCNSQAEATSEHPGCRALILTYGRESKWELPEADGERLEKITYYAPGNGGPWEVARYEYNKEGRLTEEWDPQITPGLKEKYTYEADGALKTITPPGQEPWTLEYGTVDEEEGNGRLVAVKRPTLLASPTTAQTTIAYEVPLTGTPYEMGGSSVAQWGQTDIPVDATAIFPPDQVPSSRPTSWTHATVYYMDAEGHEVNTATPSGAGTSNPSITTSETDEYGNVVRELSPDNRLRVLEKPAGAERVTRSEQLDTKRSYGAEGTQLEEEVGPLHKVRLESGSTVEARFHKVIQYDHEMPVGTTPDPHLPTRETTGASSAGELHDERVAETKYDWTLRKPEKSIVVMESGKPNIESVTVYNDTTGLPIETRQPKNKAGGGPGTTKVNYYSAGSGGACLNSAYAGLPCETGPAKQPGTVGLPELLVKKYVAYNGLGEPTEVTESPGGSGGTFRRVVNSFDPAGRERTHQVGGEGVGTAVPKTETAYSGTTGLPEKQQFVCESGCTGFDSQASTTIYNALGQVTGYEDADGNKTKTTYDVDGRPISTADGKGSQTITYDPTSGLPTKLEDSAAGTFTASYDADGNMVERTLPDGLTAKTTYNEVDEPTKLAYTKTSSCGESCTWLEESLERSIYGQIISNTGSLVSDSYKYDKAGRLTQAQETPKAGSCTTGEYKYDEDSNRTWSATRGPGVGGICTGSGGSEREYKYDEADRLLGEGLTYDSFGRITNLPAVDAGGHALVTGYYSTNMVARQEQNGITNSYELDGAGRQRARLQGGGGLEGTEVFHYDGSSDSPAWTERGATWTRYITGMGGELAAIQESGGGLTFQLTDLHGDVVATAEPSTTATKLKATYRFDEFGEPMAGSAGRFGWLGGKARRAELPSGVIQMGARSYIPSLGRFLTPDPVRGGSANPYDYAGQDPVNGSDLNGELSVKKAAHLAAVAVKRATRKANKTGAIVTHFNSRGAAERFVHTLEGTPSFVEKVQRKAGEWKEKEIAEVQAKAAKAAEEESIFGPRPAPEHYEPSPCTIASFTAGVVATVATDGAASVVIEGIGLLTGGGSLLGAC
jgi:RHS repeat-associated protein